jgi:hypothetical protein
MDDLLFFPSGKYEEALNSGHYLACVFLCFFFLLPSLGRVRSFCSAFNLGDNAFWNFQALTPSSAADESGAYFCGCKNRDTFGSQLDEFVRHFFYCFKFSTALLASNTAISIGLLFIFLFLSI